MFPECKSRGLTFCKCCHSHRWISRHLGPLWHGLCIFLIVVMSLFLPCNIFVVLLLVLLLPPIPPIHPIFTLKPEPQILWTQGPRKNLSPQEPKNPINPTPTNARPQDPNHLGHQDPKTLWRLKPSKLMTPDPPKLMKQEPPKLISFNPQKPYEANNPKHMNLKAQNLWSKDPRNLWTQKPKTYEAKAPESCEPKAPKLLSSFPSFLPSFLPCSCFPCSFLCLLASWLAGQRRWGATTEKEVGKDRAEGAQRPTTRWSMTFCWRSWRRMTSCWRNWKSGWGEQGQGRRRARTEKVSKDAEGVSKDRLQGGAWHVAGEVGGAAEMSKDRLQGEVWHVAGEGWGEWHHAGGMARITELAEHLQITRKRTRLKREAHG